MRAEAFILALALLGQVPQAPSVPSPAASVADLAFLTGSWSLTRGDSVIEEHWTAARGGTLFGVGRTIRGDRTPAFEFLRIESRRDGIYYIASPAGRAATPFKLSQIAQNRAAFENRAHDFPQRIAYWRDGERLCAEVSGTAQGKPSSERWCWDPAGP